MLYLIGGAPRAGKSTLAQMILERHHIPHISTNVIRDALHDTYPELKTKAGEWQDWQQQFKPFFKNLVAETIENYKNYVIEGDIFLPSHIHELQQKYKIKSCFIGASHITLETIRSGAQLHDDWVAEMSQKEQEGLPAWIIKVSQMFKVEAEKHNLSYFDIAEDQTAVLEKACSTLFR